MYVSEACLCEYVLRFWCRCEECDFSHVFFFFQAEDGIRDLVRSRGLGDVYKRQPRHRTKEQRRRSQPFLKPDAVRQSPHERHAHHRTCLLYTSDAADERSSVDLGGRRIIQKKNQRQYEVHLHDKQTQEN